MTGTFGLEGLVAYAYHGEHESLDVIRHFFPDSERDTWVLPDCVLLLCVPPWLVATTAAYLLSR